MNNLISLLLNINLQIVFYREIKLNFLVKYIFCLVKYRLFLYVRGKVVKFTGPFILL